MPMQGAFTVLLREMRDDNHIESLWGYLVMTVQVNRDISERTRTQVDHFAISETDSHFENILSTIVTLTSSIVMVSRAVWRHLCTNCQRASLRQKQWQGITVRHASAMAVPTSSAPEKSHNDILVSDQCLNMSDLPTNFLQERNLPP